MKHVTAFIVKQPEGTHAFVTVVNAYFCNVTVLEVVILARDFICMASI